MVTHVFLIYKLIIVHVINNKVVSGSFSLIVYNQYKNLH
jgi:hypothetical protein